MTHRFDVEKAIQATGVLLRKEGKSASRIRILKLLYIADRMSLEKTGSPILGSRRLVAMKHGPLHSEMLDLINGYHIAEAAWSRHFRNVGKDVVLEEEPDVGKLSRHEIQLLNEIVDARLNLDDWQIVDETHQFQEWKKHYPDLEENTSRPIPVEDLIEATGRGDDKESILQDMKDSDAFDKFFARI